MSERENEAEVVWTPVIERDNKAKQCQPPVSERDNEFVSVIIPVYNTSQYLKRCIESAIAQSYSSLQIILINDGSEDNSGEICDDYATKYPWVEVIHRANGGLSAARNTGLDNARGGWVMFLDSDDYISRYFVEDTLTACLHYNADIAVCQCITDREGNMGEDLFAKASQHECITGYEASIRHFGKGARILNPACGKLSRASLWEGLRFPEGKTIEDVFVSHRLLYSAKRLVITDARLYAYYQSPDSIMRKPFSLRRLDALDSWREGIRFFEQAGEQGLLDIARRVYCNRLFDAYGLCKKLMPDEHDAHARLRLEAIVTYREVRSVKTYIDLPPKRDIPYRVKQFVGRYIPALYSCMFLKGRTYI